MAASLDLMSPAQQRRAESAMRGLHGYFTELFARRRHGAEQHAVIDDLLAAENPPGDGTRAPAATRLALRGLERLPVHLATRRPAAARS